MNHPTLHLGFLLCLASFTTTAQNPVSFAVQFGGSGREDSARAITCHKDGSIYVAGGTTSRDFPTTPGTLQTDFRTGGRQIGSFGEMDAFVTKLTKDGTIVWSTLLGGPNYDRVYTVRVDEAGYIYLAGRAGAGFPTTPGVVQPEFAGDDAKARAYGPQDGFLTKLSPDGGQIIWSTYFGTPGKSIIRDLDLDRAGNLFITMIAADNESPHVTQGSFQSSKPGGGDSIVASVTPDGSKVRWCTYLGGSGNDLATSLRVDSKGRVIVAGSTDSPNFPTTAGAYQVRSGGKEDGFVACIAADGSRLEYASLIGGRDGDGVTGKHGLALDFRDRPHVTGFAHSADFPTTTQAFQRGYRSSPSSAWEKRGDRFVAIFSADGRSLEACTLIGGRYRDGGEGIAVDADGNCYLGGFTFSDDFPVSGNALQAQFGGAPPRTRDYTGGGDATLVILPPDLDRLRYSTYFGNTGDEAFRDICLTPDGKIVVAGKTTSRQLVQLGNQPFPPTMGQDDILVLSFDLQHLR